MLPLLSAFPNHVLAHILRTVVVGQCATRDDIVALRTGEAPATNIASLGLMGWHPITSAPLPTVPGGSSSRIPHAPQVFRES